MEKDFARRGTDNVSLTESQQLDFLKERRATVEKNRADFHWASNVMDSSAQPTPPPPTEQ
jgi:hypothetical protein